MAAFRRMSVLMVSLVSLLSPAVYGQQGPFKWQLLTVGGRDYVPARDIVEFYRFQGLQDSGGDVRFLHPVISMTAKANSQTLIVNKIKFITSFPMIRDGGQLLISRMDVSKLIDPILRPRHKKGPESRFNTVIIDPGHGGSDSGAVCPLGKEADFALDTGRHLAGLLRSKGYQVQFTRNEDRYITLGQRVEFANRFKNAILVSLHYNSGQSRATGIETFALSPQGSSSTFVGERRSDGMKLEGNDWDAQNIALATAIHASALHNVLTVDRGIKRARWTVLTGLKVPGVLFEGGFVSNPAEAQRISSVGYRKMVARSIFEGIENYREALIKR